MVEVVHSEKMLAYSRALPCHHRSASVSKLLGLLELSSPDAGGIRAGLYVALAVHHRIIQNVL